MTRKKEMISKSMKASGDWYRDQQSGDLKILVTFVLFNYFI